MVDASALFGISSAPATPTIPALASFKLSLKTGNADLDKFSKRADVQKDIAYFKTKIVKGQKADDIIKDARLLKIITSAFELEGDEKFPAKIREVLNSDLKDQNSFANRLIDPRYKKLAEAFGMKEFGTFHLKQSLFQNDVGNRYVRAQYEKSLGDKNPALREAAYFMRNIGNVTDTFQILGDKVLRAIVTETLGLPQNIVVQSIEKQKALIDAKLDIKKFRPAGAVDPATKTKSPLDIANQEKSSLTDAKAAAVAARTSVQTIANRIQTLQDDYDRLANIQNPAGPYAAEIPRQTAAAPELVRQNGLLASAQSSLGRVTTHLTRMAELIQLVGNPDNASQLADFQAEFADLRAEVTDAINDANYAYDDGTAGASFTNQSLLDGTLPTTTSVQIKSTGETTTIRSFDLSATSSFQTQLDAANAAFQAITGSSDTANITSASSALTSSRTTANFTKLTVDIDSNLFSEGIASVSQWAATLDTAQLYPGAEAVRDAGKRFAEINLLVKQIRGVVAESATMIDSLDRTELIEKYDGFVAELTDLIATPNSPVANLLAGGDQSYQIATDFYLKARGRDLGASVGTVLDAGDISTVAGSNAILAQLDGAIKDALADTSRELGVDAKFFSLAADTLDPRAKVDSQYRKLATDIPGLVSSANSGTNNLLDPDQSAIKINVTSLSLNVSIAAATGFDADVREALDDASQLLPTDTGDTSGALAQLNTVRFNVARILSDLNANVRAVDNAQALLNQRITDLEAKQTTPTTTSTTPFAVQFIQKYLAKKDAEASSAGTGGGSGNAYILQLIRPVSIRGGGIDTSA